MGFKSSVSPNKLNSRRRVSASSECNSCVQLKNMNLVHLDLIQQQKLLIDMRDKEIRQLRTDKASKIKKNAKSKRGPGRPKKILRPRLHTRVERMERRVSILKQRNGPVDACRRVLKDNLEAHCGSRDKIRALRDPVYDIEDELEALHDVTLPDGEKPGNNRRWTLDSVDKRKQRRSLPAPRERPVPRTPAPVTSRTPAPVTSRTPTPAASRTPLPARVTSLPASAPRPSRDTQSRAQTMIAPKNVVVKFNKLNASPVRSRTLPEIVAELHSRARPLEEDQFLRTEELYHARAAAAVEPTVTKTRLRQSAVEVPSFREVIVPRGWQMEGTENLEDEIFMKRHCKWEAEEKKRKRWDEQRNRELAQYEKLQKGRTGTMKGSTKRSLLRSSNPVTTFNPDEPANTLKYIEVSDSLPVSLFGYPVPGVQSSEFSVPWSDAIKKTNQKGNSRKRKR